MSSSTLFFSIVCVFLGWCICLACDRFFKAMREFQYQKWKRAVTALGEAGEFSDEEYEIQKKKRIALRIRLDELNDQLDRSIPNRAKSRNKKWQRTQTYQGE